MNIARLRLKNSQLYSAISEIEQSKSEDKRHQFQEQIHEFLGILSEAARSAAYEADYGWIVTRFTRWLLCLRRTFHDIVEYNLPMPRAPLAKRQASLIEHSKRTTSSAEPKEFDPMLEGFFRAIGDYLYGKEKDLIVQEPIREQGEPHKDLELAIFKKLAEIEKTVSETKDKVDNYQTQGLTGGLPPLPLVSFPSSVSTLQDNKKQ